MKIILISFLIAMGLNAQSSSSNRPSTNSLKVYKIDTDNKLALIDSILVYSKNFTPEEPYSDTTLLEEIIEIAYPSIKFVNFLKQSKYQTLDSTVDDGVTTYVFSSWCKSDTTDWETGDDGKIIFEIEYSDCILQDIVKVNENNRLLHYTYRFKGNDRSEDYKFDENDNLVEVDSPKGHFIISYDKYDRIKQIKKDYENLSNLIETMGSSLKREIIYDFQYE